MNRISQKHDLISQYSNPDYLLGGLNDQELPSMAWRLLFGDAERPQTPPPQELPAYPPSPKSPIRELNQPLVAELDENQSLNLLLLSLPAGFSEFN